MVEIFGVSFKLISVIAMTIEGPYDAPVAIGSSESQAGKFDMECNF